MNTVQMVTEGAIIETTVERTIGEGQPICVMTDDQGDHHPDIQSVVPQVEMLRLMVEGQCGEKSTKVSAMMHEVARQASVEIEIEIAEIEMAGTAGHTTATLVDTAAETRGRGRGAATGSIARGPHHRRTLRRDSRHCLPSRVVIRELQPEVMTTLRSADPSRDRLHLPGMAGAVVVCGRSLLSLK
jgi:hypothetical protein